LGGHQRQAREKFWAYCGVAAFRWLSRKICGHNVQWRHKSSSLAKISYILTRLLFDAPCGVNLRSFEDIVGSFQSKLQGNWSEVESWNAAEKYFVRQTVL